MYDDDQIQVQLNPLVYDPLIRAIKVVVRETRKQERPFRIFIPYNACPFNSTQAINIIHEEDFRLIIWDKTYPYDGAKFKHTKMVVVQKFLSFILPPKKGHVIRCGTEQAISIISKRLNLPHHRLLAEFVNTSQSN